MNRRIIIIIVAILSLGSLTLAAQPPGGGSGQGGGQGGERGGEKGGKPDSTFVDNAIEEIEMTTLQMEWAPVLVDHSIGFRFGWGTGMIRTEPTRDGISLPYALWSGGITYRFDVPAQKYVGTIMFELQYVQKGYAYNTVFDGTDVYTSSFDVIELPILWQPYLPIGKQGSRIYLNAGPFISYTISAHEKSYSSETGEVYYDRDYEFDPMSDYYWNYGISAGVGFYVAFGRWAITVDGRYTIQLSDIMRGTEEVSDNPFRSPVDHIGVSIGMQYKFSIGKDKADEAK